MLPSPAASSFTPAQTHWYPKVYGDSVNGHRLTRADEADERSSYENEAQLPNPEALPPTARHLSLKEAIALSLRDNPNVRIAELQRIMDKFGLEVTLQNSKVQWQPLTFSPTLQNHSSPTWKFGEGIGVNAVSGTSVTVNAASGLVPGSNTATLGITQPLLKGFGFAVNDVQYQNGYDNERIARLTFKNNVITDVNTVITSYRSLVTAYNSLDINIQNLKTQEITVKHSALQVKAGVMAPSDLLQQQANLETARLGVVQQQNALRQSYFSFLTSLGLVPTANIIIDRKIAISDAHVPPLQTCINIALKNNIAYLQALLNLNITKRALITAEDARKWTLNLASNVTLGSTQGTIPSVGLSLSVPIDNISLKQGEVQAKVNIEGAKMNLVQQKETLVSSVMDQWYAIQNDWQQVKISQLGIQLETKTLNNTKLKLKYGKTTVFEENTIENNLLSEQVSLVSTEISYLNDVTTLYTTLGTTLDEWKIKLLY